MDPPTAPMTRLAPRTVAQTLQSRLGPGFLTVEIDGVPVAGGFGNTESEVPDLIGLFIAAETLTVVSLSNGGEEPLVQPVGPNAEVTNYREVRLKTEARTPSGFQVRLISADREEDLLVLATGATPSVIRTAFSSVSRTDIRDLDGDGSMEMVQAALVFEAGGRRELIVDAFRWDGSGFTHARSISLLRRTNQRLRTFENRLRVDGTAEWMAAVHDALESLDGAPEPREVLPSPAVQVPEITELFLDLGETGWTIGHDLAIGVELYRLYIELLANPLVEEPVRILGL
jgi:hypothetical protein